MNTLFLILGLFGVMTTQTHAQTQPLPYDTGSTITVTEETITVYHAHERDSGIAHKKTITVNDTEVLVPHELHTKDAIALITGTVPEIVYTTNQYTHAESFWGQFLQPWNVMRKFEKERYVLDRDQYGYFVTKESLVTQEPKVHLIFILYIVIGIVMGILFARALFYNRLRNAHLANLGLVLCCSFVFSIIAYIFFIAVDGVTTTHPEYLLRGAPVIVDFFWLLLSGAIVFGLIALIKEIRYRTSDYYKATQAFDGID